MSAGTRSVAILATAVAGAVISSFLGLSSIYTSSAYSWVVTALLGFGLYAATTGIPLDLLRTQLRTVVLAVTVGVAAKAAFIFVVMFVFFREPQYVILAVAVAQIDPLSVTAMRSKSRMSDSANTLLTAWAAFDDPVTVLLTVYVTAFALSQGGDPAAGTVLGSGLGDFAIGLALNVVLIVVLFLAYRLVTSRGRNIRSRAGIVVVAVALVAVAVFAVWLSLLLAFAFAGLFLRPPEHWRIDRMVLVAVLLAAFAVGLLLAGGISLVPGIVLGAAAYLSQVVVGVALTVARTWRADRVRLALAQQNGLTAIVLALTLERSFVGTVAIIAPAILVVNVLHAVSNGIWDRLQPWLNRAGEPQVPPPKPVDPPVFTPPRAVRPAPMHAEPSG